MLLYGVTGLWLQHRSTLKIPGPTTKMTNGTVHLEHSFYSTDDFKAFSDRAYPGWFEDKKVTVKAAISLPTKNDSIVIPEMWSLRKVGLKGSLSISYVPDTLVVRVNKQDPNFGAFMNRLHRDY